MFLDQVNQIGDMPKAPRDAAFIKAQFKKQAIVSFGERIGNIKYLMATSSELITYTSGVHLGSRYFELG
ncbi:Uncharacterised protein [Vibrio cholerae]|uniref:Uncharacterized protein n=1 Tax=Vibrio cholerae TaxID=666 RepID=A0A655YV42_VIBCL|nr:Uncharacterised protein [Vibrio cholerae]